MYFAIDKNLYKMDHKKCRELCKKYPTNKDGIIPDGGWFLNGDLYTAKEWKDALNWIAKNSECLGAVKIFNL